MENKSSPYQYLSLSKKRPISLLRKPPGGDDALALFIHSSYGKTSITPMQVAHLLRQQRVSVSNTPTDGDNDLDILAKNRLEEFLEAKFQT